MKQERSGLEHFLKDIRPFFYRRRLTYVDVGAYRGEVFERVLNSGLDIGEAHLFEPNAESLEAARARAAGFRGHSVNFHRLALGARPGRVRLHAARTMTRVLTHAKLAADGADNVFEVECSTLDAMAERFTERRISLLKIDVEGHEAEVLAGAHDLLSQQRVDCLYVEAGLNPEGIQQCHYRRIEDLLRGHGYATFRIYEQHHEWLDDLPLLRRMNVAFLSGRFAQANPYRVTLELFDARRRLERLDAELAETAALAAESARGRMSQLEAEYQQSRAAFTRAAEENRQLRAELEALREPARRQAQVGAENRELVARMRTLHQRELEAWKAAAKAQGRLAALRGRPAVRAALAVRAHLGSVSGWLRMPAAVWREISAARAERAAVPAAGPATPPMVFEPGMASLSVPLTVRPQRVRLSIGDGLHGLRARALLGGARSVVVQLMVAPSRGRVLRVGGREPDAGEAPGGGALRWRLPVTAGNPTPLLEIAGPDAAIIIELARGRGNFGLLVLEWATVPGQPSAAGTSASPAPGAAELDRKLWGGYAAPAAAALERMRLDPLASPIERENAAWFLARRHYAANDATRALALLGPAMAGRGAPPQRLQMARAQCLLALHRWREAAEVIERGRRGPKAADFELLHSNEVYAAALDEGRSEPQAAALRLAALNRVLAAGDLAPLRLRDPAQPLRLSNLQADAAPSARPQDLTVSVIVPAHDAAGSIDYVLACLLAQTYRALEIIVVDDASSDATVDAVHRWAARDARVRLVCNPVNLGAYRTRNAGAAVATGDLLTVHDSDDWSHPQKIERQVAALLEHSTAVAVVSSWVRVDERVGVVGPWLPKGSMFDLNFSSLLMRRGLLDTLGPWDEVNVSGDAEFYFRIRAVYGDDAVHKLPSTQLLSLALVRPDSLTRARATHVSTLSYGLRWNYRDAFRDWHERLRQDDSLLPLGPQRRFPVPVANSPRRSTEYRYDLVVIGDFAMRGGAFVSTLNYVVAGAHAGLRVAVFHWRKYSLQAQAPLQPRLYQACLAHGVDLLGPGDSVVADSVLIGYPVILTHAPDPMPSIRTTRVLVMINQFASRLSDGGDVQYDPSGLRRSLHDCFGTEGHWIPISAWVRRLMRDDARYPSAYPQPWAPMIDVQAWCASAPRWRGGAGRRPVVGRHGRDTYTKWPSSVAALRQAYGVDQNWDVRFLGGAGHAIAMLGHTPDNWTVTPFDGTTAQDFLADLDFFVHYPHERYIEEFGRAVMEAMAVGIPCVLPPVFAETFGEAAVYADPPEVAAAITALWHAREQYLERAEAGRRFVREHCDSRDFAERLRRLVDATAPAAPHATPDASGPRAAASA